MPVTTTNTDLPGSLNLSVYQAATFNVALTWTTGDPPAPVDLTGYTAAMSIQAGQNTLIDLTTANGRIALGGAAGTVTLTIAAADTAALAPGTAEYDLLLTSAGGVVYPLLAGLVTIRESVTG